MRLQDMPGYPLNMNYSDVMNGEYSPAELSEWAIDLLANEGKCWLRSDSDTDQIFALAMIASIRPLMEALTGNNILEANQDLMLLVVKTYLDLSKSLSALRNIAIEQGLRGPIET